VVFPNKQPDQAFAEWRLEERDKPPVEASNSKHHHAHRTERYKTERHSVDFCKQEAEEDLRDLSK
jgi:hypothetical protein